MGIGHGHFILCKVNIDKIEHVDQNQENKEGPQQRLPVPSQLHVSFNRVQTDNMQLHIVKLL